MTTFSTTFTWRYEDADGAALQREDLPQATFPTQADAESWLGEEWRSLLDAGVEAVTLLEEDEKVYGPMALRPAE